MVQVPIEMVLGKEDNNIFFIFFLIGAGLLNHPVFSSVCLWSRVGLRQRKLN